MTLDQAVFSRLAKELGVSSDRMRAIVEAANSTGREVTEETLRQIGLRCRQGVSPSQAAAEILRAGSAGAASSGHTISDESISQDGVSALQQVSQADAEMAAYHGQVRALQFQIVSDAAMVRALRSGEFRDPRIANQFQAARSAFQNSLINGANSYIPALRESGGFLMPLPPSQQVEQSALPPSAVGSSQQPPSQES